MKIEDVFSDLKGLTDGCMNLFDLFLDCSKDETTTDAFKEQMAWCVASTTKDMFHEKFSANDLDKNNPSIGFTAAELFPGVIKKFSEGFIEALDNFDKSDSVK